MRIAFMGTPEFAVPCLRELAASGQEIVGVFTQPDKPVGRHAELTPPPVKRLALELGLSVFQPVRMKDGSVAAILRELDTDLCVVTAYGRILPAEILEAPRLGCMNIHASLLPAYRGAAPIQWSIVNGDSVTGVTAMFMDVGMDTGDIICEERLEIGENETAGELSARLSELGASLMLRVLPMFASGQVPRKKQDETKASYVTMLEKSMGRVDFRQPAQRVHDLIRGMQPWPSAFCEREGGTLKLLSSLTAEGAGSPGTVLDNKRLIVACSEGAVELVTVQPAGKKPMSGADYMRGARLATGSSIL